MADKRERSIIQNKNIARFFENEVYYLEMSGATLLIHIKNELRNVLQKYLTPEMDPTLTKDFADENKLAPFTSIMSQRWGFGKAVSWKQNDKPGWCTIECPLVPKNFHKENFQKMYNLSATLEKLFEYMYSQVDYRTDQLLLIRYFSSERKMHGCSFSVRIMPRLCNWINKISQEILPAYYRRVTGIEKFKSESEIKISKVLDTMLLILSGSSRSTNKENDKEYNEYATRIRINKFFLNLSCPGDSCGLDPENYDENCADTGYKLLPHNLDSPFQQFTLLAGLAKICQLAREDGY